MTIEAGEDKESTVFTMECFLRQGNEFCAGSESGYPVIRYETDKKLFTEYAVGSVFRYDKCSVYYSKGCVSIVYYDAENDEQNFYAVTRDSGVLWEETDMSFTNLLVSSDYGRQLVSIYHQEFDEGHTVIVTDEGNAMGLEASVSIYWLENGVQNRPYVNFRSDNDDDDDGYGLDYIRACYFEDEYHGYISCRYRKIEQPVCFKFTQSDLPMGGHSWKKMNIEADLDENSYGEICAFQKTEQGIKAVVWIPHNAQGEPQVQTIMLPNSSQ